MFYLPQMVLEKDYLNLWGFLKRSTNLNSLASCAIIPQEGEHIEAKLQNGLVAGHAVS